ncbi:MAG: hypothetical protein METHAR1v1_200001 [Methanothrix sp.]|nr:MAG: hypothetical protein METHAR1v1_200001 [Methanothrix sp.]
MNGFDLVGHPSDDSVQSQSTKSLGEFLGLPISSAQRRRPEIGEESSGPRCRKGGGEGRRRGSWRWGGACHRCAADFI